MAEYEIRLLCPEDGCTYCWDEVNERWVKVCPVDELPLSIQHQLIDLKDKAKRILRAAFTNKERG